MYFSVQSHLGSKIELYPTNQNTYFGLFKRFLHIFTNYSFLRISTNFYEFLRISTNFYEFLRTPMNSYEFYEFLQTLTNFYKVLYFPKFLATNFYKLQISTTNFYAHRYKFLLFSRNKCENMSPCCTFHPRLNSLQIF